MLSTSTPRGHSINKKSAPPISNDSINKFVASLRESLRGDKRENNCFRFVLENQPKDIEIEKSKGYIKSPNGSVTLLAIMQVIEKDYKVYETWEDTYEDIEPASELEISIDYENKRIVYEHGYIELENVTTHNRLTLFINTETGGRPYYKIYAIDGTGEAKLFLERINAQMNEANLYHLKTFTLQNEYPIGLLPKFIKPQEITVDDIILPRDIADEIQANVIDVFLRKEEYEKHKIPTKRGVLLEGPPGNGKTLCIKYINNVLNGKVTFIYITDGAIRNAADITEIFDLAREYQPVILVFEDIDTIGLSRDIGSSNFTSELLAQLDGLESLQNFVILASTNHAELIDDALKNRPNRFDRRIKIDFPKAAVRERMLKNFLAEKDVVLSNEEIKQLSMDNATKDFSGAALKESIITAKMYALDEKIDTTYAHIVRALSFIKAQYRDNSFTSKSTNEIGFRTVRDGV